MAHWEIVLDGWSLRSARGHLEHVQMWWVNTDDGESRKPFNAYLRRYLELDVRRADESTLLVRLAGDRKEYQFSVEVDEQATPAVFADVQLADGSTVTHCRCDRALLVARRVLGVPVGIAALTVRCIDAEAIPHEGTVPYRVLGSSYGPVQPPSSLLPTPPSSLLPPANIGGDGG